MPNPLHRYPPPATADYRMRDVYCSPCNMTKVFTTPLRVVLPFVRHLSLVLALVHFGIFVAAGENDSSAPLRIGYQNSPPYQLINNDGTLGGIGIDLVRESAARLNIELEWVYSPQSPDHHIAEKEVDLWPVVTDLPHRRKLIHITEPIYQNSLGILSLNSDPIRTPEQAKGRTIAYFDREPSLTLVPKLLPTAVPLPLPNHSDAIQAVFEGEADGAFLWSTKSNSVDFKSAIESHQDTQIFFYAFPEAKLNCGIGADASNPVATEAADAIREEIRQLVREGFVQSVYFKYFLDPENEITSYFLVDDLQTKTKRLEVVTTLLVLLVLVLAAMALVLRKSRQKADAASKAKTEFLANMSHEFRTPLNGIMGMTQLAIHTPANDSQKEMLEIVLQSANVLLTIVNDILDLSKIESGRLSIEKESVKLDDVLSSTIPFFNLVASQKGLNFECKTSESCPKVIVSDAVRLRQILFNLIGNAVKFTSSGEITVTVDSIQTPERELLLFEVKDTGVGIPESLLGSIFDAFTQVDSSSTRGYGGTGLGLTISNQLARLLGGEILVESVDKKGSVFSVLIPLIRVESAFKKSSKKPFSYSIGNQGKLQILVVDDNELNLHTMRALINLLGHEAVTVDNGSRALELCKERDFDLIFMDLQMPEMDGWETARSIRTTSPDIPIVALTASIFSEHQKERVLQEMNGLVFKPFEVRQIQDEIERQTNLTAKIGS